MAVRVEGLVLLAESTENTEESGERGWD